MESVMMPITIPGKTNDIMEWPKRSCSNKNNTNISHNEQQIAAHGASQTSGIRASSLSKTSYQGFLNWVAYTRNLAPRIHEIDRRTCPLIGCEKLFEHPDEMLLHLKICPLLSKGSYRCIDSGREERIGKCTSRGCLQLQHCKDRFAAAMISLKRRLSPRGSRPLRFAEARSEKQTMSPGISVMDQIWDDSYPVGYAELSSDVISHISELESNSISNTVSELDATDNYRYHSVNVAHDTLSELASGNCTTFISELSSSPPFNGLSSGTPPNFNECYFLKESDIAELDGRDYICTPSHVTEEVYLSTEINVDQSMSDALSGHAEDALSQGTSSAVLRTSSDNWGTLKCDKLPQKSRSDNYELDLLIEQFVLQEGSKEHPALDHTPYFEDMNGSGSAYWVPSYIHDHIVNSIGCCSNSENMGAQLFPTVAPETTNWDSSVSSLGSFDSMEFSQSSVGTSNESPVSFFNDPSMMCDEPDSINIFQLPPEREIDSEVSEFDRIEQSISTVGKIDAMIIHNLESSPRQPDQPIKQPRVPRKPTPYRPLPDAEPMSAYFARASSLIPDIDYSLKTQTQPEHACGFCKRAFNDKSNRNRHQTTCKVNSRSLKSDKPYRCTYRRCTKSFTRSDNLLVHQKKKKHEMKDIFSFRQTTGLNTYCTFNMIDE